MAAGYIGGSVCVQKDGRILVAHSGIYGQDNGRYWVRGLLIRLTPDGKYDTTFGDGGKLLINLDGLDHEVISIALTDEEKILVFGSYLEDDSENAALNAFVIRLEKDGKRDRSFNGQKFVIKNDELKHIRAGTISVRNSDGAIVVAGSAAKTHDFGLPSTPWIAVLNANGSPNLGFNAGKPLFSSILPDGGFGKTVPGKRITTQSWLQDQWQHAICPLVSLILRSTVRVGSTIKALITTWR
ncbi:hypothetical protein BOO89_17110 [Stutzerimonas stutzeri]|nr:hypothetical protein BOO89_17110 [Stutzerimonas stutzeri]